MNKTLGIILIVLVVLVLGGAVYYANTTSPNETDQDEQMQNDAGENTVPESWQTYSDEASGLTFRYPEGAETNREAGHVVVKFIGPESEPNTEITDGYTFSVDVEELPEGETLESFAEAKYEEVTTRIRGVAEPEAKEIKGKRAQVFLTESELGPNITHAIVEGSGDAVFVTSYNISDPSGSGYEEEIRMMIGTLALEEAVSSDGQSGGQDEMTDNTTEEVKIALLDSELAPGESPDRGCDKVVMVTRSVEATQAPLTSALEELFSLNEENVDGSYNFIARTNDTLSFDRAEVENGTASIYLEGKLSGLAGVCDNPRAKIQIEETALQFSTVDNVALYLNGEPTGLQPDMQGA